MSAAQPAGDPVTAPIRGRRGNRVSGDEREKAILAHAEQLLGERPLHDISVDDLARGAGISRPTFYFYFQSKEAVILTLLDRVASEARTSRNYALARMGQGQGGVKQVWRDALTAIHETFLAHRAVVLAASELFAESAEVRDLWARVMQGFVDDTAAVIELERARGAAPDGPDARDLAVALNWMNERVFFTNFADLAPSVADDRVLDVLFTIWSRTIYLDDSLGG